MIEQITKREARGKKPYTLGNQPFFSIGRTPTMYFKIKDRPVEQLADYAEKLSQKSLPWGIFEAFAVKSNVIGIVYERSYVTEQKVIEWVEKNFGP